mmetsp:Transcript_27294/g.45917  ORF Transcript_27294/g.45917 Transcript_27294/m.45917 type:complete len:85 (-) Transcript_27294:697-951(-)
MLNQLTHNNHRHFSLFTALLFTCLLQSLTQKMRNTEYNPKRYPGLILRSRQPRSVASIFASGKVVVAVVCSHRLQGRSWRNKNH